MTFEPLGGGASASGSSMIFSPFAFCFSSISSMERIDIAVVELARIELAGFPLDQHRGHVEQVGIGLVIADVAEEARRFVHLVGIAQRLEQHAAAARLQRNDIFLPAHRKLAHADLLRRLKRVAQHDIGLLGQIVGRDDVIGLLEIGRVDVVLVDELRRGRAFCGSRA